MKIGLLIFWSSIFLIACKSNNNIPHSVLAPAKMQAVLWDMMRADQLLNSNILQKDSSKEKAAESIKLYQQVFRIHGISKEKFQKQLSNR